MRMADIAAAVLALALMLEGRQGAAPVPDNQAFLLAVLNRDGLAIPFAAFTGRRWTRPWPESRAATLPINLDSVDQDWWGIGGRPERMRLWLNGEKLDEVSFESLVLVRSLCSARVGLRTTHKPRQLAPPRLRQPYPKDGMLVSGGVP